MIASSVLRLLIIVHWSSVVSFTVNGRTAKFFVDRPGQIPVADVWSLATVSVDSVIECAMKCWSSGYNSECVGFLYRPENCKGTDGLLAKSGSCDFVQFFNLTALLYRPASSNCEEFYASTDTSVNIALDKPATHVWTYASNPAPLAVDGNIGTISCTGTLLNPWWSVDLLRPYRIAQVDVVNDNNTYFAFRLNNFYVKLANEQPTVGQQLSDNYDFCAQYNGFVPALGTGKVVCSTSVQPNRYVIVQGSLTTAESLCLAEVSVYLTYVQLR